MTGTKLVRLSGLFGLSAVVLVLLEIPLWVIPGAPVPINDAARFSNYLGDIRIVALSRVLIDMGIYVCLMCFFAGFRYLIIRANADYEWLGTLVFGAGVVWWSTILVANSLQGGAVIHTVGGNQDPTAVRALVEGTLFIFNGPVMFAACGLFMASASYAILATKVLPKLTAYIGWVGAAVCAAATPAVYVDAVDVHRFYNVAGWGPGVATALVLVLWLSAVGYSMVRMTSASVPESTGRTEGASTVE